MVLGPIDYTIIIVYLIGTVAFGAYIGRKIKSGKDYFLAGRSLPWWAIGMSLVVSDIGPVIAPALLISLKDPTPKSK